MTLLSRHRLWQVALDAGFIVLAWWLAFVLRFDVTPPAPYQRLFERTLLVVLAIKLAIFVLGRFYQHWWRYASVRDMWSAARAVALGSLLAFVALYLWNPVRGFRVPSAVLVLDFLILLALIACARLFARTLMERPAARDLVARGREVFVVGAGDAGRLVIGEMQRNRKLGYTPIGLIDDNPRKRNMRLHGVRVLGATHDLPHLLRENRPDEVILAIPAAAGEARRGIVNVCREAKVPVKTLPGVYELLSDDVQLTRRLREVQVEDVLGRDPVRLDVEAIASYLEGTTVLVTGAGGSIGSELCRQIVAAAPERLVLVDNAETALVEIGRELSQERGFQAFAPVLADVTNMTSMRSVFGDYRPAVVFHASAYKHVPLLELNAVEATRNNLLATKRLAEIASEYGTRRFVLVSTDKAVNPANVLGQTKALCEWVVAAAALREANGTRFISVRFGNVLGSSGSVVPLFRRQIKEGGPVTVTHPEMTRYFMTIPEAVHLTIQAGAIGESGEVFILDMGRPVPILQLARNMIRLSGKEPGRDIEIAITGLRAGEKLHEELWGADEQVAATPHPKILRSSSRPIDPSWLEHELAVLEQRVEQVDADGVVVKLDEMLADPVRLAEPAHEIV